MKLQFTSPAERKEVHQHIREAAREIEADSPILQSLFHLENGEEDGSKSGFGWTHLNEPTSSVVRFPEYDYDEFDTLIENIENVSAGDLGDSDDEQLTTIAEYLSDAATTIRDSIQDEPTSAAGSHD